MTNLRNLIVCEDPSSKTTPRKILNQWNNMGMKTELWNEQSYFTPNTKHPKNKKDILKIHHKRQAACYETCMKHLNKNDRTWTMLIDVDEYLSFNSIIDYEEDKKINAIIDVNKGKKLDRKDSRKMEQLKLRTKLPINEDITIAQYIKKQKYNIPWNDSSCMSFPRLHFYKQKGPQQSHKNLSTLNYFSHATKGSTNENGLGKSIVDVSRMHDFKVRDHHSINKECGQEVEHMYSLLRVNHYQSRQMYVEGQEIDSSYEMQGWFDRFVGMVGLEKADDLLKGGDNKRVSLSVS